jgi:pimeloyl-ACP methyl ester carboxylesterase
MDAFEKKTLKTSRGYTYTYYTSSGDKTLPTLIFQHGFPDDAATWKDVAGPLKHLKHPIIVPDMLGYDGTDKPKDPSVYKWDVMTKDLIEILDAENAEKCISIGHDWGSSCASRLYNYHPDRVAGLVNLNVVYNAPPREPFDLDTVNAKLKQAFGYQLMEYWNLFTAPDGPEVLNGDLNRLFNCMHSSGDTMKHFFCEPNAMRDYLTGKTNPEFELPSFAQDAAFKRAFIDRMKRNEFESMLCWYKAMVHNYQYQCDKELPKSVDRVEVPMLYIGCTDDAVCRPEGILNAQKNGQVPKLEQAESIKAGHWVTYEKPNEVVVKLEDWLKRNYH